MTRKTLDCFLSILIWPLMLKVTLAGFFGLQVGYFLCLLGEFTLFGAFRIVALGLRPVFRGGAGNKAPVHGDNYRCASVTTTPGRLG